MTEVLEGSRGDSQPVDSLRTGARGAEREDSAAPDAHAGGLHGPVSRLSFCVRCRAQFAVCQSCERGQVYCDRRCAREARRDGLRAIRARYRRSPEGKEAHREQEQRRRQRRRADARPSESVGDQGSPVLLPTATLRKVPAPAHPTNPRGVASLRCRDCGCVARLLWANGSGRRGRRRDRPRCRPTSTVKRSRI